MIVITGNNGEGSGMITNYAIEKLLEENLNACIILLDNTSEFSPLRDKLNGSHLSVSRLSKTLEEQMEFSHNYKFFHITFDEPIEYNLEQIKRLEKKLSDIGRWVFVIFKSTDKEHAYFIQREYEKL